VFYLPPPLPWQCVRISTIYNIITIPVPPIVRGDDNATRDHADVAVISACRDIVINIVMMTIIRILRNITESAFLFSYDPR